ncbi:MAG TPA: hypothetical protein EYP25_11960 [Anaerolineae bacterium]|nr:hypothetical protein [Anaerolineae bacterium]
MTGRLPPLQTYLLHCTSICFHVEDADAARRLAEQWRPFQIANPTETTDPIRFRLTFVDASPAPPDSPLISSGPDVSYFRQGDHLAIQFHGWGRFDIDLKAARIEGVMARAAIARYGVFEDMILLAMTPLLRRRGYFPLHAFAAAVGERALALVGDIGAGKTTTGLALLLRGARLIANDAPLVRLDGDDPVLHAYPGLISAYPDTIARFPRLARLLTEGQLLDEGEKISFPADAIMPEPWRQRARPAALLFPAITPEADRCHLDPLSPALALAQLVAQSIESWDAETIPAHVHALRRLVEAVPAYRLILASDITHLPDLLLPLAQGAGRDA